MAIFPVTLSLGSAAAARVGTAGRKGQRLRHRKRRSLSGPAIQLAHELSHLVGQLAELVGIAVAAVPLIRLGQSVELD